MKYYAALDVGLRAVALCTRDGLPGRSHSAARDMWLLRIVHQLDWARGLQSALSVLRRLYRSQVSYQSEPLGA